MTENSSTTPIYGNSDVLTCPCCRTAFFPVRKDQVYCKPRCQVAYNREIQREVRAKKEEMQRERDELVDLIMGCMPQKSGDVFNIDIAAQAILDAGYKNNKP